MVVSAGEAAAAGGASCGRRKGILFEFAARAAKCDQVESETLSTAQPADKLAPLLRRPSVRSCCWACSCTEHCSERRATCQIAASGPSSLACSLVAGPSVTERAPDHLFEFAARAAKCDQVESETLSTNLPDSRVRSVLPRMLAGPPLALTIPQSTVSTIERGGKWTREGDVPFARA
jgi:hypothetical protein